LNFDWCVILSSFHFVRFHFRQYTADELEPLSRAGLEALLMQVKGEYRLREDEDQLYLDATKPIRALLANAGAKKCWAVAARDASG
jgi:hypothetical protein